MALRPQKSRNITEWGIEMYAEFDFTNLTDGEYAQKLDAIREKYDVFEGDTRFRICPIEAKHYVKQIKDLFLISFKGTDHEVICLYEKRGLYCFGVYSNFHEEAMILGEFKFNIPKGTWKEVRRGVDYSSLADPASVSYTRRDLDRVVSVLALDGPHSIPWGRALTAIVGCSSEAARSYAMEYHVAEGLNITNEHTTHLPPARTVCIMKRWSKISKDIISGDYSFVLELEDGKAESNWEGTKQILTWYSAARMLAIINSKDKEKEGAEKEQQKVGLDSEVKGRKGKDFRENKGRENKGKKSKETGPIHEKGVRYLYFQQKCSLADILESPVKKMRIYATRDLDDTIIDTGKVDRIGLVHPSMIQAAEATQNFSSSLRFGPRISGTVYKGQLQDGQVVAIKRAEKEHFEDLKVEIKTVVELLANIDHQNLVKLLGYVDVGNDCLIITEYVPYVTLRDHLDGLRGNPLDLHQRLGIVIDIAQGLTYLHKYSLHKYAEKEIIYGDIKSTNILLTESMRAKVADFGFVRHGDMDSAKTHVLKMLKGAVGYVDPEYIKKAQLVPKSDVFSFGVLILEILTGLRSSKALINWASMVNMEDILDCATETCATETGSPNVIFDWWTCMESFHAGENMEDLLDRLMVTRCTHSRGNMEDFLDRSMVTRADRGTWITMFKLAFCCMLRRPADRPRMEEVCMRLWEIRADSNRFFSRLQANNASFSRMKNNSVI